MAFFTVSGNVLATYVLPGLPAFALLLAAQWRPAEADARALRPTVRFAIAIGLVIPVVGIGAMVVMQQRFETVLSHKALVRSFEAQRAHAGERLIYVAQAPISAEFYTQGKALIVHDAAALLPYLADARVDFVVVHGRDFDTLPADARARLTPLGSFGEYRLLREAPR